MTAPDEQPNAHADVMADIEEHCLAIGKLTDVLLVSMSNFDTASQREIMDGLARADVALRELRRSFQRTRISMEMDGLVPPG